MQNTMVRGGGEWPAGEKIKLGVRERNGKVQKEENYIDKGGKGLKNASFWAIITPQTYLFGKKMEKGKKKRRKITLKKGKEALKMHLLGL